MMVRHSRSLKSYTFAFQPIIDIKAHEVFSYEALIRGPAREPASWVLGQVPPEEMLAFDREARNRAIRLASRLGLKCRLNLNYLPQSQDSPAVSILMMLTEARRDHLPIDRLVLEVTECGAIENPALFAELVNRYRASGLKVALDDFGAGYSGLNLLVDLQPDMIKLDMKLVQGIDRHGPRQAIVRAIRQACVDLGIDLIAEGVETEQEFAWLANEDIHLFQGFLLAEPGFECLPLVCFPVLNGSATQTADQCFTSGPPEP